MSENMPPAYSRPVTAFELALTSAEVVLAIKSLKLAFMSSRLGNDADVERHLADLDVNTERLWRRFEKLTGKDPDE